ncbi:MAG: exopolysaccharide biosynthesis protein [Xanthobacteraceae bacterium]
MSETQQTRPAFVAASTLLQQVHEGAPAGHFTLEWLMTSLHDQSYAAIILLLAIAAAAPGISLPAGFLLLVPTFQMIAGRPAPTFPQWIATRPLPTDKLTAVLKRAIPALKVLEMAVRPRWPMPLGATRRIVGLMVLLLTVRLLSNPLPASNVLPAALISFISLAYLEADGLMLTIGLLAGLIALAVDARILFDVAQEIVNRIGLQSGGP